MNRYRKTYAARGLLDWQMALNVSGAILKICFTGGNMGSNGVIPAKFTTENEAIQKLIEQDKNYKNGRIFIHNSVKIAEPDSSKFDVKGKK